MNNIVRLICWLLVELAFIGMAVFLSVWTSNYHFLWFLVVPIIGFIDFGAINPVILRKGYRLPEDESRAEEQKTTWRHED